MTILAQDDLVVGCEKVSNLCQLHANRCSSCLTDGVGSLKSSLPLPFSAGQQAFCLGSLDEDDVSATTYRVYEAWLGGIAL